MPVSEQQLIAHYRLLHRLAHGGMSDVYLAYDTHTERTVALKLVERCQHHHCERLRHEAEAFKVLKHDHILPIFEYSENDDYCYIVMPYIADGTLRERLHQGPLTTRETGTLLLQLADALQFAHTRGILHCDIKPSNILLQQGEHVYLADFGLAHRSEEESDQTQVLCTSGTPAYMAPELIKEPPTISSDIYAVGVLLYHMLAGRAPFKSSSLLGVHWQHLHTQPERPSACNPFVSPAIDRVVLHALEKDASRRFHSMRELAQAYTNALADEQLMWVRRGVLAQQSRSRSRPSLRALVATFCLLPTLLGFSFYNLVNPASPVLEPATQAQQVKPGPSAAISTPVATSSASSTILNRPLIINSDGSQNYTIQVSDTDVQGSPVPSPQAGGEPPAHGHSHHSHQKHGGHSKHTHSHKGR